MTPEQLETLAAYHDSQKKYWGTDSPPGKSHRGWAAQLRAMAEESQRLADAVTALKVVLALFDSDLFFFATQGGCGTAEIKKAIATGEAVLNTLGTSPTLNGLKGNAP